MKFWWNFLLHVEGTNYYTMACETLLEFPSDRYRTVYFWSSELINPDGSDPRHGFITGVCLFRSWHVISTLIDGRRVKHRNLSIASSCLERSYCRILESTCPNVDHHVARNVYDSRKRNSHLNSYLGRVFFFFNASNAPGSRRAYLPNWVNDRCRWGNHPIWTGPGQRSLVGLGQPQGSGGSNLYYHHQGLDCGTRS